MSRDCPRRSASEVASLEATPDPPDAAQEIHPDDCEVGDDGMFEEDDAEMTGPASRRDFLVDLWPFSRPESFYKQLLTMLGAAQSQVLVVASSAARPSVVIAARDLKLQAHLLSNRSHHLSGLQICHTTSIEYVSHHLLFSHGRVFLVCLLQSVSGMFGPCLCLCVCVHVRVYICLFGLASRKCHIEHSKPSST